MTLSELEEEARKRKERLAQWKLTKQNANPKRKEYEDDEENNNNNQEQEQTIEFPKPIFRNYKPSDSGQLSDAIVLPKPKLIDVKSIVKFNLFISFPVECFLLFRSKINRKNHR